MARFYQGVNFEELVSIYHTGTPSVQKKVLEIACKTMKGFIVSLMQRKYPTYIPREGADLIQSGQTAVCEKFKDYDPAKGKPTTFFAPYIEHAMLDWMIDNVNGFSIHYQTMLNKIKTITKENPNLTDKEVSEMTGVPETTVAKTRNAARSSEKFSLDERFEHLSSKDLTPEEEMVANEKNKILYGWLDDYLGTTEKDILFDLFGLDGRPVMTVAAICHERKIPRKEVEEVRDNALKKLNTKEFKAALEGEYSFSSSHTTDVNLKPLSMGNLVMADEDYH